MALFCFLRYNGTIILPLIFAVKNQFLRKTLLYSIAFILYGLTAANFVHALSLFLGDLGPNVLPYQFVAVSLLIIAYSLLSSYLTPRLQSNRIFSGTLLFFILNYALLMFLPLGSFAHTFYFLVIANFMFFLEELSIMHFLNSLMTPLQAKRALPVIFGFSNLGWIVGALFAPQYQHIHELFGIGTIPIGVLFITIGLVVAASKVFRREIRENFESMEKAPFIHSLKKAFLYVHKESRLYKWLGLVVFLVVGLQLTIEFKLKTVLAHTFSHELLTEILGLVFAGKSVLVWLYSTFISQRVLFRLGVGNTLLLYPVSVVITLIIAVFFGLNYIAVIALFVVFSLSHFATYGITTSQILSVVPKGLYHSVYFLLKGLFYAFGLLVFSLSLLVYTYDIRLETSLNTATIAGICLLLIFGTLKVKELYFKDLKENLYKSDLYLKHRSIDLLAEKISIKKGEDHLRRLLNMQKIEKETQARVIASLGVIGNYQTIIDLAKILPSDQPPKVKNQAIHAINEIIRDQKDLRDYPVTKHYLLKAYEGLLLSDVPHSLKLEVISALKYFDLEDVVQFLEEHLTSDNPHMVANTIRTFAEFHERGIIPYIEPYLEDGSAELVSEAIVALWQFEEIRIHLLSRLAGLLSQESTACTRSGLYVIGSIKATWEKGYVLHKLENEDMHIKRYALITLIRLGDNAQISSLIQQMLELAKKGEWEELDFLLSWYRQLDTSTKNTIIHDIQQLKAEDSQHFLKAFKNSKYVFTNEVAELS